MYDNRNGEKKLIKTLKIDGKQVQFKATADIPKMYKKKFKRNFVKDLNNIVKTSQKYNITPDHSNMDDLKKLNLDMLANIFWTYAKNADKSISNPKIWIEEFETFPALHMITELKDLIIYSLTHKGVK